MPLPTNNDLKRLRAGILEKFPEAAITFDPPDAPNGIWWMDTTLGKKKVVLEYRPERGFGISLLKEGNAAYGEGPDTVKTTPGEALAHILELLEQT